MAAEKVGRGLTGYYETLDSSGQGNAVQATLSFRLFNATDEDASRGTLILRESLPPHAVLGSIKNVLVRKGGSAVFKGEFVVPSSEYNNWRKGGRIDLSLQFQKGDGTLRTWTIELKRGPTRKED